MATNVYGPNLEYEAFIFHVISLRCGTNFDKPLRKKKEKKRRGKHVSVLRVLIYLFRFIQYMCLDEFCNI